MSLNKKIASLLDRLDHLHRSYLRDFAYSQGLNLRQLEALIFLSNCNKYSDSPLALSEYLGLTKGTVSQTVISLENKKLLIKEGDSKDGRLIHLYLTSKGKEVVRECVKGSYRAKALAKSNDADALESSLVELLKNIQHINDHKTFGTCYTCKFFRPNALGQRHQCGLTLEPLYTKESLQICREHSENPDIKYNLD